MEPEKMEYWELRYPTRANTRHELENWNCRIGNAGIHAVEYGNGKYILKIECDIGCLDPYKAELESKGVRVERMNKAPYPR